MKRTNSQKDGFTIMEAALVLGIAGMIFLMMLIALPALQRQARDTERREDVEHVLSKIKDFQTNNRGGLPGLEVPAPDELISYVADGNPTEWTGFYHDYLGENFVDPAGEEYKLKILQCGGHVASEACDNSSGVLQMVSDLNSKTFDEMVGTIYIVRQALCAGRESTGVVASSNPRRIAILYKMENSVLYCVNT